MQKDDEQELTGKIDDILEPGLPTLSENSFLRYLSFIALYLAQGIPEGLTFFGIPAWMAMNGKTPAEVGSFIAVIGIPWSFKILIAPFMDRFTFLAMGRRRPWVLFGQLGLMISFAAMAFVPDPLNNLSILMLSGFFVSFFGAFQDVATDGMAIDIVPIDQQARANGLMWGSKIIGTSISLVIGNHIINNYGFEYAVLALAMMVSLIMIVPLLLRERPGEKFMPWTKGKASEAGKKLQVHSWSEIGKSLYKVVKLSSSLFMGVGVFIMSMCFGLMDAILPVFTIQVSGWTDTDFSHVYAITSIIAGILGMMAGGALADIFGKVKMMSVYLILIVISVSGFSFLESYWMDKTFMVAVMMIYYFLNVFLVIAIFATAMELCWKRVSATQFTLYMAVSNLGRAAGAGLLGPLSINFSWNIVIISNAVFAILMLILINRMRLKEHLQSIELLEESELKSEIEIKSGVSI